MKPGDICAISAGPVRLARVESVNGKWVTLRALDDNQRVVRLADMLWNLGPLI